MNSELFRLLLENAAKLSFVDVFILLILAASVASTAAAVIHWIYKHALDKQGEVIKSQDKLIDLKDKTIAEYEQNINRLADERSRTETELSHASQRLKDLDEQIAASNEQGKKTERELLLYASAYVIGVLIAQNLFYRLVFCQDMRRLVRVYAAVSAQRRDDSAIPISTLLDNIQATEDYLLEQAQILDQLGTLGIAEAGNTGVPKPLLSFSTQDERARRVIATEDFIVANTLPLLKKYEPEFASRVETSYKKRIQS